jgi:HEAT repeat protein
VNLLTVSLALALLAPQAVYSPADFVRIPGNSLKARYDGAVAEGRRGNTDTFWLAYQFPVRPGVRVDTRYEGVNINRSRSADGIEFVDTTAAAQRVGLFILMRKSDSGIERTRILNLDEQFRVHDRRVYWLGEPNTEESLALLTTLVDAVPPKPSSILMTMGLHPSPQAAESLLRVARTANSTEVKKDAVFWLGQEVSRQAGEELEKMAKDDPEVEVQKQAVFAISQRNVDEAVPSLLRIAREHPNSAVRKQAIFWLGQKRDSRVVDFFEQMLKK